jgi:hypothetical protein
MALEDVQLQPTGEDIWQALDWYEFKSGAIDIQAGYRQYPDH